MDVSSEDEDSHGGLEEDIGGGSQDGDDTGSKASEGSPQAKTGKGPSGTRARRWFPVAQCSGWEEAQVRMQSMGMTPQRASQTYQKSFWHARCLQQGNAGGSCRRALSCKPSTQGPCGFCCR